MSTQRTSAGAPFDKRHFSGERGPNGRPICRGCGAEVGQGRSAWCSQSCYASHAPRTNQAAARRLVFERDRGFCSRCGLDTEELLRRVLGYPVPEPDPKPQGGGESDEDYQLRALRQVHGRRVWRAAKGEHRREGWTLLHALGFRTGHGQLWEANHIRPVVEGGGECGLENLETLCVPCHRRETTALAGRLAEVRREAAPGGDG